MVLAGIEFKPVKGFEKYYMVSKDGAVISLHGGGLRFIKFHINPSTGYPMAALSNGKNRRKTKPLHRVVAETWIENPDNLPCINHINENKLDNHVYNLEWCTKKYNNTYNGKAQRCCKRVKQIDIDTGKVIKIWLSAREASKEICNGNYRNISAVCRGRRNKCHGYRWEFE